MVKLLHGTFTCCIERVERQREILRIVLKKVLISGLVNRYKHWKMLLLQGEKNEDMKSKRHWWGMNSEDKKVGISIRIRRTL